MPRHRMKDKLLEGVLHRAASDPEFRAGLLADPGAAIHAAFGVTLPREFTVRFIQKPADVDLLVVLPDAVGEDELSDDDLEQVAGGTGAADAKWSEPPPPPPPTGP